MKSLFKSEQGKQDILRLYDEKLKELGVEYEYLRVSTSFGATSIIATGDSSKPPIILVHGSKRLCAHSFRNVSKPGQNASGLCRGCVGSTQ